MNESYRCPNCGNLATRYRRTRGDHICQRCGHQWAILGVRTRPDRTKSYVITAVCLTVLGFACAVGEGSFFFLIAAVGVWAYIFFTSWWRRKKESDSTADEYSVSADGEVLRSPRFTEAYYCTNPNCEQELSDGEQFCSRCGTPRVRPLAETQYLVCGSCERELEPATQFCPGCGTQVIHR
jgi:predicted RNA-binding Zn-ribbon protein involved in translation (DUF1610 family)